MIMWIGFLENQLLGFTMIIQKAKQFLRRSGNIDGFNAEIIMDENFNKILIILCNTDTSNLQEFADKYI